MRTSSKVVLPLLLLAFPAVVQAQFTFTTNNGAITITGYTGPSGAVTIPSTISGWPVTSIGDWSFTYSSGVTSVSIPNSVISIGDGAFWPCTSLTSVMISNGVTSLGDYVFEGCSSLTSVTIPASVTNIGDAAFVACSSLTAITVDTNNLVYSSVAGVLFNQSQSTLVAYPGGIAGSYTIPNSVTSIGDYAFSFCAGLTSVTIPNSITNIGDWAFLQCARLTSVTIPNNVTNIGYEAFEFCTSLTGVYFNGNAPRVGSGVFDGDNNATVYYEPATTGWASTFGGLPTAPWPFPCFTYTATDGTVTITKYTCSGGAVTLPSTIYGLPVTGIGTGAFQNSYRLTSITIPDSVTSIGNEAFLGSGLTSVTIPDSVASIGYGAFSGCYSLTTVAIGNGVTSIGEIAFNECTSLTNVTIPNSVTNIGVEAFFYCTSLKGVTIGNSVTNIGDEAFAYCTSLTGVYFQGNAPGADSSVFAYDDHATVFCLPGTTGWAVFSANTGLTPVLWNPLIQTGDGSFGVLTNGFGFNISGSSNLVVVVEATTNLANPLWSPVGTNSLTGGSSYFSDPRWTNYPARLYRLRSL